MEAEGGVLPKYVMAAESASCAFRATRARAAEVVACASLSCDIRRCRRELSSGGPCAASRDSTAQTKTDVFCTNIIPGCQSKLYH